MNTIIFFCAVYLIYISAAYAFLHVIFKSERRHYIRHICIIFGTAVLAYIFSHFLKDLIAHPRPVGITTLLEPRDPYSFPSGHTTFSAALGFAMYSFDKRAGKILLILALIIGVSRVLAGVHFWYDIVGGFVLGAVVAYICFLLTKKIRG
ncbi:MAG: phosphoesterase PA-phosphatase related protein [Candidatus Nomurabacteria bacterium]|nr:phosphoesterase PA-phosphatase related protein [Candidatus Nomurabacteria bacterium]